MADDPEYIDLLEQLVMKRLGQGRTAGQTPKQTPKPKARYDPGALAEEMFFGEASATGDPIADVAADVAGGERTPLPGPPPQGGRENGGSAGGPVIDAVSGAAPRSTPPPAPEPFRRPALSIGPTGSRLNRADAWAGQKLWRDVPNAVVGALVPRQESIDAVGRAVRWLMENPDSQRGR